MNDSLTEIKDMLLLFFLGHEEDIISIYECSSKSNKLLFSLEIFGIIYLFLPDWSIHLLFAAEDLGKMLLIYYGYYLTHAKPYR